VSHSAGSNQGIVSDHSRLTQHDFVVVDLYPGSDRAYWFNSHTARATFRSYQFVSHSAGSNQGIVSDHSRLTQNDFVVVDLYPGSDRAYWFNSHTARATFRSFGSRLTLLVRTKGSFQTTQDSRRTISLLWICTLVRTGLTFADRIPVWYCQFESCIISSNRWTEWNCSSFMLGPF